MGSSTRFFRYVFPVLSAGAALLLRMWVDPFLGDRTPYATFYVSSTLSAILGGPVAGGIATILGGASAVYFLLPPERTFIIHGIDYQLGFALYLFVSAVLVALIEERRRAARRLEREIAERKVSEADEHFQRRRFEVTLSSIGDGVIATDAESRVTFLNGVAAELTGWPLAEAQGRPIERVFCVRNEQTNAEIENPAARAIRDGRIADMAHHTVLISKSGRRIPIEDSGAPMRDESGAVVGAVMVFRDISEVRRREAELQQRNRMIDLSHDAIIVADPARRITSWNLGAQEIYGWTQREALGQIAHDLLQTRNSERVETIDAILIERGRWDGQLVHTCKDGRTIVADSRQVLLRDTDGAPAGILEINRDITDRRHAEEELRRTAAEAHEGHRLLEALMNHIPEGVAIADAPDARLRMVSRYGAALVGRPVAALENVAGDQHAEVWGIYHSDGKTIAAPEELPLTRAVVAGEVVTDEEWVLKAPDGASVPVLCNAAPIRDAEGRITGGLIAWRDMTERKRLDEKLREAAKLESIGILAGGIAHDFNNLLTGILGFASLLKEDAPEGSSQSIYSQAIAASAAAAAKLTQQMLAYSGRGRYQVEYVDISRYIRETTALISSAIPKHVDLRFELAESLPAIRADVAQLQQLVMNLVINAAEAIPPSGGRVTVSTAPQTIGAGSRHGIEAGDYVCLEVSDTGCGMDEATVARIFDPFFTTKFIGRGLGLAAVQGIIRGHKAAIDVRSAPGQGTTFRVLFPVAGKSASAPEPPLRPVAAGRGTVLVIDDEEIVRSTAEAALRRLGYGVIAAEDGARGVDLFRAAKGHFAAVILDMTMPGMSGEDTLRQLRSIRPDVPIVLSSGFSEAEALQRFDGRGLAGFLQKPYTLQALAERLAAAVAVGA